MTTVEMWVEPAWRDYAAEPVTEWLRGIDALDTFDRAARRAERAGQTLPCRNTGELWLSEQPADRAAAVAGCQPCPLRVLCDQAATASGYTFGVWGGHDRTIQENRTRACDRCQTEFTVPIKRGPVRRLCDDCRR